MVLIGKSRSASTDRNSCPTAPVAPTMATFTDMTTRSRSRTKLQTKKKTEPADAEDAWNPSAAASRCRDARALRVQHVVGFIGGSVGNATVLHYILINRMPR